MSKAAPITDDMDGALTVSSASLAMLYHHKCMRRITVKSLEADNGEFGTGRIDILSKGIEWTWSKQGRITSTREV